MKISSSIYIIIITIVDAYNIPILNTKTRPNPITKIENSYPSSMTIMFSLWKRLYEWFYQVLIYVFFVNTNILTSNFITNVFELGGDCVGSSNMTWVPFLMQRHPYCHSRSPGDPE